MKAIIAEHRALALGSTEWADLSKAISDAQNNLNSMGFPARDVAVSQRADAFENEQLRLVELINRRQQLLDRNSELDEQLARTSDNISKLEDGIANAKGGVVSVSGDYIDPIAPGARKEVKSTGHAAQKAVPELTDYANVMKRIKSVFEGASQGGATYSEAMNKLRQDFENGDISAEAFASAMDQIEGKIQEAEDAAKKFENIGRGAFVSLVTGADSFKGVLNNLANQLASMAANSLFDSLFGGLFKVGGSLLGGPKIPAYASGTNHHPGGLAQINERGGEIVNLPRGTQVIPHDISKRMADQRGGSVTVYVEAVPGAEFVPRVQAVSQGVAVQVVQQSNKGLVQSSRRDRKG